MASRVHPLTPGTSETNEKLESTEVLPADAETAEAQQKSEELQNAATVADIHKTSLDKDKNDPPKEKKEQSAFSKRVHKHLISILTVGALLIAALIATILRYAITDPNYWTMRRSSYVGFVGELFVNMLQCMVIPLITTTMIAAIGSIDVKVGKFVAARGFSLFALTTFLAVLLGLALALIVGPGSVGKPKHACPQTLRRSFSTSSEEIGRSAAGGSFPFDIDFQAQAQSGLISRSRGTVDGSLELTANFQDDRENGRVDRSSLGRWYDPCPPLDIHRRCRLNKDTILDMIRSLFPSNIVEASIERIETLPDFKKPNSQLFPSHEDCAQFFRNRKREHIEDYGVKRVNYRGTNVLGLMVFSIALGIAALHAGAIGLPLMNFFISFAKVTLKMTSWIIWISPLGICSLVLGQIVKTEDLYAFVISLIVYLCTVALGFIIQSIVVLPLIYFIFTKKSPVKFYKSSMPVLWYTFFTSSSTDTVPLSIEFLETKAKVDQHVSRFIVPIGSSVHLNGHGLYLMISALYIAQTHQMILSFGEYVLLCMMCFVGSIATPGIPSGGLFTMTLVLIALRIEPDQIAFILPVEWLLDKFMSTLNVQGDLVVSCCVNSCSRYKLRQLAYEEAEAAKYLLDQQEQQLEGEGMPEEPVPTETDADIHEPPVSEIPKNDVP